MAEAKVPFQILAFDGGGIRGAFGVGLVAQLEEQLGRPITDFFDLVAGTSTGAITAAGLAIGMSGKQLMQFYEQFGEQIFTPREPHKPQGWPRGIYPSVKWLLQKKTEQNFDDFFRAKYCPIALKDAFDNGFGTNTLGDVSQARLIVPTVNLSLGKSHIYRSPHLPDLDQDKNIQLVDVLLATTAAPTYFPHKSMPDGQAFCDGGLWANSPCMIAIAEAMKIKQQCHRESCDPDYDTSNIRMLSIGTGTTSYPLSPPGNDAGILYWAQHVANVMINLQVEGIQSPLEFFLGDRYQSINFELPDKSWSLDNTDYIEELFQLGATAADNKFEKLSSNYFESKQPEYVPF